MNQRREHYSHSLQQGTQEKIVGVFVLLAMVLLLIVFVLNSRSLYLFENTVKIQLLSPSAQGIARDTPVRAAGIEIGQVDSIEITKQHGILINARIYERYFDLLRDDSAASVGSLSVLGRSSIEISVGSPHAPRLVEGALLALQPAASVDELLALAGPLVNKVDTALTQVNQLLHAVEPARVEHSLAQAEQLLNEMTHLLHKVNDEQGLLHWLLQDDSLQHSLTANLAQIEQLLLHSNTQLQHLDSTLPLVNDTLLSVQGLSAQGGALMDDLPQLLDELRGLTEQSQMLMDQASRSWPLSRSRRSAEPELLEVMYD